MNFSINYIFLTPLKYEKINKKIIHLVLERKQGLVMRWKIEGPWL